MIDSDRADRLYVKMHESMYESFDSKELETLTVVMTSGPVIKAFGRAFYMCRALESEMATLDMSQKESQHQFSKCQGQIEGIKSLITGLLALVTEEEEEDNSNDSA